MENRVVDLCLAMDYWVFGGYVRDVFVCSKREFSDIDICVPRSKHSTVDHFINALSVFYTVDVTRDTNIANMKYAAMSKGIKAVVKITLNSQLKLDLCLFAVTCSTCRARRRWACGTSRRFTGTWQPRPAKSSR
jgi:predicted nucleotidyltransferase